MLNLENLNTTLIIGASSGIGEALAEVFAKNKHDLVLVARRKQNLIRIKEDLEKKYGVKVIVVPLDLSKEKSIESLYKELKKRNINIDILVNNAGFGNYGKFTETDLDRELNMIDLNVKTLTYLTKLFLKDMVSRDKGKIMNVASVAAFLPGPMMPVYFASKAYVLSFSEAISKELENTGITITALCPGATKSEFQKVAGIHSLDNNPKVPSSMEVAEYGYKALMKNKVVAVYGLKNNFNVFLMRFLPRQFIRWYMGRRMY